MPVLLAAAAGLPAQQPIFRTDSSEILVDFVVRDKKGKTVPDLTASDVRVYENGVEQSIVSFRERRNVIPEAPPLPPVAGPQPVAGLDGRRHLPLHGRYVVLVFDRIDRQSRRLARQAALHFVEHNLRPDVFVAVYKLDRGLFPIQLYTNDAAELRAAVLRATAIEKTDFDSDFLGLEEFAILTKQGEGAANAVSLATQGGTQITGQPDTSGLSVEQAHVVAQKMLELSVMVNREDLGRVPVFALWSLVKDLRNVPGRKSIVYFSGGLELPNALWLQFRSMLSDANRANVSFYAIDSRGLSPNDETRAARDMLAVAAQRSKNIATARWETFEENIKEFRTFDLMLDSIKANNQVALAELAESTGGFLFANTNDFRPAMTRLSEELNSYYEITYRPSNAELDGRYRAISVKVGRLSVSVQARNGYFALPLLDGESLKPFEVALLRALGRRPPPRELEFLSGILRYRSGDSGQQGALVFDMPLDQVTFTRDEAEGKWRTHLSVLALVKDEQGHVVAKLSRDVPLNEPFDRLAGFRQGRFIVTQPVRLPPGRYTLEAAAADVEGQRVATKKSVYVVLRSSVSGPRLSDAALIRRIEKPVEGADSADPFHLASGRIIPTLFDVIPSGDTSVLSVFLTLYPEPNAAAPRLVLDLLQDGRIVSRGTPSLPPPDPSGAIPYLAGLPLKSIPPGQYEFRATLIQDQKAAQSRLSVTIE